MVPSGGEGPFAMRLRHGWTLTGPLKVSPVNVICHRISVREKDSVKELLSPQVIQQMFELDFTDPDSPNEYGYSQDDKKLGIRRHDGHYVLPLPFRNPQVRMPNNRKQALQ